MQFKIVMQFFQLSFADNEETLFYEIIISQTGKPGNDQLESGHINMFPAIGIRSTICPTFKCS